MEQRQSSTTTNEARARKPKMRGSRRDLLVIGTAVGGATFAPRVAFGATAAQGMSPNQIELDMDWILQLMVQIQESLENIKNLPGGAAFLAEIDQSLLDIANVEASVAQFLADLAGVSASELVLIIIAYNILAPAIETALTEAQQWADDVDDAIQVFPLEPVGDAVEGLGDATDGLGTAIEDAGEQIEMDVPILGFLLGGALKVVGGGLKITGTGLKALGAPLPF